MVGGPTSLLRFKWYEMSKAREVKLATMKLVSQARMVSINLEHHEQRLGLPSPHGSVLHHFSFVAQFVGFFGFGYGPFCVVNHSWLCFLLQVAICFAWLVMQRRPHGHV